MERKRRPCKFFLINKETVNTSFSVNKKIALAQYLVKINAELHY